MRCPPRVEGCGATATAKGSISLPVGRGPSRGGRRSRSRRTPTHFAAPGDGAEAIAGDALVAEDAVPPFLGRTRCTLGSIGLQKLPQEPLRPGGLALFLRHSLSGLRSWCSRSGRPERGRVPPGHRGPPSALNRVSSYPARAALGDAVLVVAFRDVLPPLRARIIFVASVMCL